MSHIIYNAIQTPDGTIIESRDRWDYVEHKDENGKVYMVDGGLSYLRRTIHEDQKDLSVTTDAPHGIARQAATWGTYGINGDQPLKYISVSDMETEHIEAVLRECRPAPGLEMVMVKELQYRLTKV